MCLYSSVASLFYIHLISTIATILLWLLLGVLALVIIGSLLTYLLNIIGSLLTYLLNIITATKKCDHIFYPHYSGDGELLGQRCLLCNEDHSLEELGLNKDFHGMMQKYHENDVNE